MASKSRKSFVIHPEPAKNIIKVEALHDVEEVLVVEISESQRKRSMIVYSTQKESNIYSHIQ